MRKPLLITGFLLAGVIGVNLASGTTLWGRKEMKSVNTSEVLKNEADKKSDDSPQALTNSSLETNSQSSSSFRSESSFIDSEGCNAETVEPAPCQ
jgi:hypothetical protein